MKQQNSASVPQVDLTALTPALLIAPYQAEPASMQPAARAAAQQAA